MSQVMFEVTTRLELAPRTVTGWHCKPFNQATIISICGGDRTRTYNLSINSALLYAIELHPHLVAQVGLEPTRLSASAFETDVYTNSTTEPYNSKS